MFVTLPARLPRLIDAKLPLTLVGSPRDPPTDTATTIGIVTMKNLQSVLFIYE